MQHVLFKSVLFTILISWPQPLFMCRPGSEENTVSIHSSMYSFVQQIFQVPLSLRWHEKRMLTLYLFTPSSSISSISGSWDLVSAPFSKTDILEVISETSYQSACSSSDWSSLQVWAQLTIFCLLEPYALGSFFISPVALLSTISSLSTFPLPEGTHLLPPVSFITPGWVAPPSL